MGTGESLKNVFHFDFKPNFSYNKRAIYLKIPANQSPAYQKLPDLQLFSQNKRARMKLSKLFIYAVINGLIRGDLREIISSGRLVFLELDDQPLCGIKLHLPPQTVMPLNFNVFAVEIPLII